MENNKKHVLNFEDLKCIIIGKYTISFMPKNMNNELLTTRIEYKDEIINIINKKDILIVDNN